MSKRATIPGPSELKSLTLASHALCPYVQRAVIVAIEKAIVFDRVVIDLGNKPAWFVERSPTGKVPLLMIGDVTLFESAAIAEFLDEISGGGMLPRDPVERARHRAWIEYASGTLAEIGALYSARDAAAFEARREALVARFQRVSEEVQNPWFGGDEFGIVDAAFAPVFRYLDEFEREATLFLLADLPNLADWRDRLLRRESVKASVLPDFPDRLHAFLVSRNSHLSQLMSRRACRGEAAAA